MATASTRISPTAQTSDRSPSQSLALRTTEGTREWLVVNRRGSFAMGTVDRELRRKYHGCLTVREPGVGDPLNMVADFVERVRVGEADYSLGSGIGPGSGAVTPAVLQDFTFTDCPVWTYRAGPVQIRRTLRLARETDGVELEYEILGPDMPVLLQVRPLLLFRPLHALTFRNPVLDGRVTSGENGMTITPYPGLPALHVSVEGIPSEFEIDGGFHEIVHEWERDRGYEFREDTYSPGILSLEVRSGMRFSVWAGVRARAGVPDSELQPEGAPPAGASRLRALLERASEAFLVRLGRDHSTVIAGYPWFGEWSRDTLISLPGLCLARGDRAAAIDILESVARRLERGLIPNIPGSPAGAANLDSLDASLLFIHCVEELWALEHDPRVWALSRVACSIVDALAGGADPRVSLRPDGLLFISEGPWALTWMDAKVDGVPVTPRHGYAVDVNALFLDALSFLVRIGATEDRAFSERWKPILERGVDTFRQLFWSEELGYLADSHDGRTADFSLRPNQLWAVCLPFSALDSRRAFSVVDAVRDHLLTPVGLRTLSPLDPKYRGTYEGGQRDRDLAYHQGAVWPWLLGLYAGALVRLGQKERLRTEVSPILETLLRHMETEGCIGQIAELFDGNAPHRARGAPAQAWSVAEVLRTAVLVGS